MNRAGTDRGGIVVLPTMTDILVHLSHQDHGTYSMRNTAQVADMRASFLCFPSSTRPIAQVVDEAIHRVQLPLSTAYSHGKDMVGTTSIAQLTRCQWQLRSIYCYSHLNEQAKARAASCQRCQSVCESWGFVVSQPSHPLSHSFTD